MTTVPGSSSTTNHPNNYQKLRKPTCAVALDGNLEELKRLQGLESLRPYVIKEKCFPSYITPNSSTPITIDELKKLARAWKLNERRNFWKTHTTQDQLVEVLKKHIQDTINPTSLPPVKQSNDPTTYGENKFSSTTNNIINNNNINKRPRTNFTPTFRTKKGEIRSYCGHKLQNKIRNSQDIVSRSRYFQFPDETNNLLNMIHNWRADDFSRHQNDPDFHDLDGGVGVGVGGGGVDGSLSLHSLSMTSSKLETQAEQQRYQTHQRNKLIKQRALAIHLLLFTISSKFSSSLMDRKSIETFLDVGESLDPDIIMNCALAISNLASHITLRPILLELNCIHRYSSFLPLLTTPHTSLGGGLFLYYMSCEVEVEDRLCSAGFKTLQKNATSDNFQLRLITLQCLSNLMPCQERIRIAELVVTTLHHMYRDYLDETWNEEILQVLLHVTSFSNCLRVMMDADIMDIISLAAAEVRDNILCGRLISRILSHFLHQLDLGEDLIHADYSRIFIDLLSLDDSQITEMCMHAFAVMSSHDLLIQSVSDSDIVHIVCGYIASSDTLHIQIIEDIARYLCNICQPNSKYLEQRVHDGAAHALLDLFRLCPNNDYIQQYAIIGIRDILTNLNNCYTLSSLMTPALIEMLKLNIELLQKLDVNVVQCVFNICLSSDCHTYLTQELKIDLILLDILNKVYERESVTVVKALLQVLIILADMEEVVSRLLSQDILEFLLTLVDYSYLKNTSGQFKECWNDISRLLLVMIHSQPQLTNEQQNCIVKILPKIGTKSSTEDIISDCAIILAYLSYSLHDFTSVDPIVRSIIHLSESDNVMNATSTVLYNISCNTHNSAMLLSDGMLHVNIMIKMMRNGNISIQQNIAETMKLLCVHSRCNELLLKNDLLSDFIVIALLRTNSSSVKKVCSEAFYNMLCHHSTRKKLLSGDLWWAMMRLSKTDLSSVRMVCAKAVYNLTCDPLNIKSLRNNYILSFIKEIAFEEKEQEYQDIFIHVLHHIIVYSLGIANGTGPGSGPGTGNAIGTGHETASSPSPSSSSHESLNHTEMIAIIQILINGISKSTTIESSQWIGYLLAIIAKECLETKEINEFIHMDIISMLKIGSNVWIHDMICRRYYSTVLALLCSQYSFTNSTLITDMLPILSILIYHEQDLGRGEIQPLPLDQMICENICSVLHYYAQRQQIDIITMISIPFFTTLMTYAITGISPYKEQMQKLQLLHSFTGTQQHLQRTSTSSNNNNHDEYHSNSAVMDMMSGNGSGSGGSGNGGEEETILDQPVTNLCAIFLKLLVFILPKLFESNARTSSDNAPPTNNIESRITSHRSLYAKKLPSIEVIYKVKSSLPMRGFMNTQLYLNDLTRNNVLFILHTICSSSNEEKIQELLSLRSYFKLLNHLLVNSKKLCHNLPFIEFCSVVIRNITFFPSLHPLLVMSSGLDSLLLSLIRYKEEEFYTLKSSLITKKINDIEQNLLSRLYDMLVILYRLSQSRLYPSHVITPTVVLSLVSEITKQSNDNTLNHMTKLIIGLVVDKTEDGSGFDPSFIRAILSEINDENSLDEETINKFLYIKSLQYIEVDMTPLPFQEIERKSFIQMTKEQIDSLWVPIISNERKKMEYFPIIQSSIIHHNNTTTATAAATAAAATNTATANSSTLSTATGGGAGGGGGGGGSTGGSVLANVSSTVLTIEPVIPFPMAIYEKIIKKYPYVNEPVVAEAKREREEKLFSFRGDNELGILEEEVEDFPNIATNLELEEGSRYEGGIDELNGPGSPIGGGNAAAVGGGGGGVQLSPRPPDSSPRSTPNMKSSGRVLVQSKGNTSPIIQRDGSNDSNGPASSSTPRKR